MWLLAGLGNPGPDYESTRHNIGFDALDTIAEHYTLPDWRAQFHGLAAKGTIAGESVLLLKPQTYMNRSGISLAEAARFYKIPPEQTAVFHDELDLAPGKVKAKLGGGHAGHNGLRSIDAHFGNNTIRIRIGIGHPGHRDQVTGWVLGREKNPDALEATAHALHTIPRALPALFQSIPDFLQAMAQHKTP